jgi:uncharacterized protein YbjT (DUF2867 family)
VNVLVAGASGVVGREVVELLKQRGHWVRTLSKDPGRAARLRERADDVRVADATSATAVAGLCRDIEVVVSALGAPVSPSAASKHSFAEVDVRANLNLLAEAEHAGARRFVYVGVYTEPAYAETVYVRAHRRVEDALRRSGLEYGFVRTTGIFGALVELLPMAKKGRVPLIGDGSAATNPVHERDVAEAVLQAVEASGASEIELGGPETLTRRQIAEAAFTALALPPRFMTMPVWFVRALGGLYGVFNRRMGELLRFVILASTHRCVAPSIGKRRLEDYFRARATASLSPDQWRNIPLGETESER